MFGKKYVLLDRDGTIIVNKHYQSDPDITELLPHAREGLELLRAAGFGLVLVTNQSGIGRGYFTRTELAAVNRRMIMELGGGDDFFEGIYYCPHLEEDDCLCRKPRPGMLELAAFDLGFSLQESYIVGDRESDIIAGEMVRATTLLVRTGSGREAEEKGLAAPTCVVDDLLGAAEWIIEREDRRTRTTKVMPR